MKLEKARLLIVLERGDYRTHLNQLLEQAFDQAVTKVFGHIDSDQPEIGLAPSDQPIRTELPRTLPILQPEEPSTTGADAELGAIDLYVLEAANYWRSHLQEVAIFSIHSVEPYSKVSATGVRLMGGGLQPAASADTANETERERKIVRLIADYCPTHLVICTPSGAVLGWANRNQIPSVVLLRDWQEPLGWKQRWWHRTLINHLNHDSVAWVGSHGAYACKILEASGISDRKLIPWGWPQPELFEQHSAKPLRYRRDRTELVYVGAMNASAGVSDLLQAVGHLQQKGHAVHLSLICQTFQKKQPSDQWPSRRPVKPKDKADEILGQPSSLVSSLATASLPDKIQASHPDNILGKPIEANQAPQHQELIQLDTQLGKNLAQLRKQIEQLNLSECITVVPALSESALIAKIRAADLIVIPNVDRDWPTTTPPSLHLAMAARTPVIAADCPHFSQHLLHGVNAMIFPVGNAKSMAHRIERVMGQPQLYKQLSEALEVTVSTLNVPAQWAELIDYWLNSAADMPAGADNHQRLCNWAFSSGRYQTSACGLTIPPTVPSAKRRFAQRSAQRNFVTR